MTRLRLTPRLDAGEVHFAPLAVKVRDAAYFSPDRTAATMAGTAPGSVIISM